MVWHGVDWTTSGKNLMMNIVICMRDYRWNLDWIGNWIYWILLHTHTQCMTALYRSLLYSWLNSLLQLSTLNWTRLSRQDLSILLTPVRLIARVRVILWLAFYHQSVCSILSEERTSLSFVHNCCWPSPVQSFSNWSPTGLMTIFYFLKFEIPPTWRARSPYLYPPGTWWPSYIPKQCIPFYCFLWIAEIQWRYLNPHPDGEVPNNAPCSARSI
jgi:hypothetical protein